MAIFLRKIASVAISLILSVASVIALKETAKVGNGQGFLDLFGLTGDVTPSTYPALKFNQNVNNDSTFTALRRQELKALQEEALRLMPLQRQVFSDIRKDVGRQSRLVDELAVAMERQ
ncbi:BZIP-type transcription factor, putative [Babesia ovis]|uniref:BZIP-type transcription factor, putative n=1 Tax=Babesia ovis TaxID=5869 RepID=A0A9W5WU77_BABOV|nr:BZIP-type transcription factor, putative [Babesia ovis]